MFFKPEEFENAGFHLLLMWTETILKTELFENDGMHHEYHVWSPFHTNLKWLDIAEFSTQFWLKFPFL